MTHKPTPRVDIIIPSFNRSHSLRTAVDAALSQSWGNKVVCVIDDGSDDDTRDVVSRYFDRDDFQYLRLRHNLGTAGAKNVGLLLTSGDAVTFHDSDDIPHRDKLLHQARALTQRNTIAAGCLNWRLCGHHPDELLKVTAVLTHHELILPDGRRVEIRRTLSLVDDVFPNLQMGNTVDGDWTHINSGLFAHALFQRLGGFEACIEEDREFRNRIILGGEILVVVPELLLTKIETADSLTQSGDTGYRSARRHADREMLWHKVKVWRETGIVGPVEIDLPDIPLNFVSNPRLLQRRDIPMTPATARAVQAITEVVAPSVSRRRPDAQPSFDEAIP